MRTPQLASSGTGNGSGMAVPPSGGSLRHQPVPSGTLSDAVLPYHLATRRLRASRRPGHQFINSGRARIVLTLVVLAVVWVTVIVLRS